MNLQRASRPAHSFVLAVAARPAHALVLVVAAGSAGLPAAAVAQGGAAAERAALEALYEATGGDGWTDNTNWLSDAPLRDWFGVEAGEDGRVTGLRLGGWVETARDFIGNGLTGTLPAGLGTLSRLRSLEIGGNPGLIGPIPAELGDLTTNLESLILQANRLTGPIPAEFGRLTDLEGLALGGGNPLSGRIPPEGDLVNLTALELRNTMLSGPLPEALTGLSALEWLALDDSGLCVPDTPAARAWLAAISDFTGAVFCEGSPDFLRIVTLPGLGVLNSVHAVADLDGDGRDDILAGGLHFVDGQGHPLHGATGADRDRRPAERGGADGVLLDGPGADGGGDAGPSPASAGAARSAGCGVRGVGLCAAELERRGARGGDDAHQGGALDGAARGGAGARVRCECRPGDVWRAAAHQRPECVSRPEIESDGTPERPECPSATCRMR